MATTANEQSAAATASIFAPLRLPASRRIWGASLLSNLGLLIMGVGAAWSMTQKRPIGSVRWKETTPDRARTEIVPVPDPAGGH